MTKKIKIVSVLSSIISHLYALVVLGLGVALLVSNYTGTAMQGILAEIDGCYAVMANWVGISSWIIIAVTTLLPALLIEVFTYVQTFSPKASVDKVMLVLTTVVMALCSVLWLWFVSEVIATPVYAIVCIGTIVLAVLLQVLFTVLLFACVDALEAQSQKAGETVTECATEDTDEVEHAEEDTVAETEGEPAETAVAEEVVDDAVQPAVVQEQPADSVVAPYQPQDTMSTVDLLSSVYGHVDSDAPVSNEVLAKIAKLEQFREQGLITAYECDKLCSDILRNSNN